jgi:hypothetical protein
LRAYRCTPRRRYRPVYSTAANRTLDRPQRSRLFSFVALVFGGAARSGKNLCLIGGGTFMARTGDLRVAVYRTRVRSQSQRRAFARALIGLRFLLASLRFALAGFRLAFTSFRLDLICLRLRFFAPPRLSRSLCQSSKNSSCRRDLSPARLGVGLRKYSPTYRRSPFCQRAYGRTTTTGAFPLSGIKDFGDRVRVAPCQKP